MSLLNPNRSSRAAAMLATQAGRALPPPSLAQSTFFTGVSPSDVEPAGHMYVRSPDPRLTEKDVPEIFKRARANRGEGQEIFDTVIEQIVDGVAQFSNRTKVDLIAHGIQQGFLKQEHLRWFEGELASWLDQINAGGHPIFAKDLGPIFRIVSSCEGFSSVQERLKEVLSKYFSEIEAADRISLLWHIGTGDSETAKQYAKEVAPLVQEIVNNPKYAVDELIRHQAGQLSALLLLTRIDIPDAGRNSCIIKSRNATFLRALSHVSSGEFDGLSIEVDTVRYGVNPTFNCKFEDQRAFIFVENNPQPKKVRSGEFVQIRDLDRAMEDQILKDRDVQILRIPLDTLLACEDIPGTFRLLIRHGSHAQERSQAQERVVIFE